MKSKYDKSVINDVEERELFKIALDQARNEGSSLWNYFSAFLIANSIFVGFIAQMFSDGNSQGFIAFLPIPKILSIAGMIMCILWFGTYFRSSNSYHFRMAQARQKEPEGWNLIGGDGYQFTDGGNQIEIKNPESEKTIWERHSRGIGRFFPPRKILPLFILIFLIIYVVLFFS